MPLPVKDFRVAVLAVDCQDNFANAAFQGNEETEQARWNIEVALPQWRRKNWLVYSIFSKAATPDKAGVFPLLRQCPQLRKDHESAFVGSDLDQRLKLARRSFLVVAGYHLTTCVAQTAIHGAQRGYDVYLPLDLCGEGDRGRHLAKEEFDKKKQAAINRMAKANVNIVMWRDLT